MVCLTDLPDEVLKLVMQHVPLMERLASCCLVSRKMHAAAVAATSQLSFGSTTVPRSESALKWLCHYGHHLTSLWLAACPQPLQQLHCQHLQQMELCTCSVQLGAAADGTLGVLHRCTNLTSLIINSHIFDTPAGAVVDSLSSLVHLQHLRLRPVAGRWTVTMRPDDQPVGGLSHATLPSLQRLTHLDVNALSMENLLQLGALTCLQELRLWTAGDVVVGPGSVPGLVFPASLKTLVLSSPVEAGILSLVPAKLQALRIRNRLEGPAEGPVSLLSCMAKLQHLTELSVQPSN
jgi:hypothetical protein